MFNHRSIPVLALSAVFLTAASSVAAAATISEPKLLKPGATIPVDFPGYDEPADDRLPAGYRMIQRKVAMQEGEVRLDGKPVQTRITAPKGFALVALEGTNDNQIRWAAADRRYAGKRSVVLQLTAEAEHGGSSSTTIYALAKRR